MAENTLQKSIRQKLDDGIFGKHSHAIYCGAYFLAEDIDNAFDADWMHMFITSAFRAAQLAVMQHWIDKSEVADIVRNHCHLLAIDEALIEASLNMKIDEIVSHFNLERGVVRA